MLFLVISLVFCVLGGWGPFIFAEISGQYWVLFRAAQVKSDCPGMPDRLQSGTWVPVIEWVQYKKWVTMVLEDQKSQKVTEATLWERVAKVKLQDTLVKIGEMDFIWIAALEAQASGQDCARLCCNRRQAGF